MFNSKEQSMLSLSYFNQIFISSDICEVQSQNGDHWLILKVEKHMTKAEIQDAKENNLTRKCYFSLLHRHKEDENYHKHAKHIETIYEVVDEIIQHDEFRLKDNAYISTYREILSHACM